MAKKNEFIEELNEIDGYVKYNSVISPTRSPKYVLNPEEYARMAILRHLENLGFKPEMVRIEHEFQAGNKNSAAKRLDIYVMTQDNAPFTYIEVKSIADFQLALHGSLREGKGKGADQVKTQLFALKGIQATVEGHAPRWLILATCDASGKLISKTIDANKYSSYKDWISSGRDVYDIIPTVGQKEIPTTTLKNNSVALEVLREKELMSFEEYLHDALWGGGEADHTKIFDTSVGLFLAKIHDEDTTAQGDEYSFQYLKNDTEESLRARINRVYIAAVKAKLEVTIDSKTDLMKNVPLGLIKRLSKISIRETVKVNTEKDLFGDLFERITTSEFKQSKAQFFTHPHIVEFCWDSLAIHNYIKTHNTFPKFADLSAGSGTFLIKLFKIYPKILRQICEEKGWQPIQQKCAAKKLSQHSFAEEDLYACEVQQNLGVALKTNMICHGDGSTHVYTSEQGNGFSPDAVYGPTKNQDGKVAGGYTRKQYELFDLIATNPPYSVEVKNPDMFELGKLTASKDSEWVFLERYYQTLRENGRIAVVLPESVFTNPDSDNKRKWLFSHFKVVAIVSLPETAFKPFSTIKTSVLFAEKGETKESDNIAFFEAEKIGFQRTKRSIYQTPNDLPEISQQVAALWNGDYTKCTLAMVVPLSKILKERSARLDASYWKYFGPRAGTVPITEFIQIHDAITLAEVPTEGLVNYVEIGDVRNLLSIPQEVELSENPEDLDVQLQKVLTKIKGGDIMLPRSGTILFGKTRPYLKKIALPELNCCYTKAFISIGLEDKLGRAFNDVSYQSMLLAYLFMQEWFIELVVRSSRIGKNYPTIDPADLLAISLTSREAKNIRSMLRGAKGIVQLVQTYLNKIQEANKLFLGLPKSTFVPCPYDAVQAGKNQVIVRKSSSPIATIKVDGNIEWFILVNELVLVKVVDGDIQYFNLDGTELPLAA